MKNVIYSKYSNDRADMFKIRTSILEDEEGNRYVQKFPLTKEAEKHIDNIYIYYLKLKKLYENRNIYINECTRVNKAIQFEYVQGVTLEEKLDAMLINENYKDLFEEIKNYIDIIYNVENIQEFEIKQEFIDVFGRVDLPIQLKSARISNIDAIFSNIITKDKWNMIDYEWTFEFPIPINYIIYRALHYYMYTSPKRTKLIGLGLYEFLGITEKELKEYEKMEKQFQKYILGPVISTSEIYNTIQGDKITLEKIEYHNKRISQKHKVQVFYDKGEGFNEADSYCVVLEENEEGKIEILIPVTERIKALRIDPAEDNCIVKIDKLLGDNGNYISVEYTTNGKLVTDNTILYLTKDPQILINDVDRTFVQMRVELQVKIISESMGIEISKKIYASKESEQKIKNLETQINELEINLEGLKANILDQIEENRVDKLKIEKQINEIEELQTRIQVQENEIGELQTTIQVEQDELGNLYKTISGKDQDILYLNTILIQYKQDFEKLNLVLQENKVTREEMSCSLNEKVEQIQSLNDKMQEQNDYITEVHNTKVWKLYTWYRKILGRV